MRSETRIIGINNIGYLKSVSTNTPYFESLLKSIDEIGLLVNPVVSEDINYYWLEDGHLRIEALKKLGKKEVSCTVLINEENNEKIDKENIDVFINNEKTISIPIDYLTTQKYIISIEKKIIRNIDQNIEKIINKYDIKDVKNFLLPKISYDLLKEDIIKINNNIDVYTSFIEQKYNLKNITDSCTFSSKLYNLDFTSKCLINVCAQNKNMIDITNKLDLLKEDSKYNQLLCLKNKLINRIIFNTESSINLIKNTYNKENAFTSTKDINNAVKNINLCTHILNKKIVNNIDEVLSKICNNVTVENGRNNNKLDIKINQIIPNNRTNIINQNNVTDHKLISIKNNLIQTKIKSTFVESLVQNPVKPVINTPVKQDVVTASTLQPVRSTFVESLVQNPVKPVINTPVKQDVVTASTLQPVRSKFLDSLLNTQVNIPKDNLNKKPENRIITRKPIKSKIQDIINTK